MDLFLALVAATTFPLVCLGFLLVMARLEDSIPEGLSRIGRTPDPAPIVAVPVRRTTAEVPTHVRETPHSTVRNPTLNGIPVQREPETVAAPSLPPAVAPEPEPLAGT